MTAKVGDPIRDFTPTEEDEGVIEWAIRSQTSSLKKMRESSYRQSDGVQPLEEEGNVA